MQFDKQWESDPGFCFYDFNDPEGIPHVPQLSTFCCLHQTLPRRFPSRASAHIRRCGGGPPLHHPGGVGEVHHLMQGSAARGSRPEGWGGLPCASASGSSSDQLR